MTPQDIEAEIKNLSGRSCQVNFGVDDFSSLAIVHISEPKGETINLSCIPIPRSSIRLGDKNYAKQIAEAYLKP